MYVPIYGFCCTLFITAIQLAHSWELHDSYICFTFCLSECYNETADFRFCQMNCHLNAYTTNACRGSPNKDTGKNTSQEPPLDTPIWNHTEPSGDIELQNPRVIELEWDPVDRAQIYVLEYREIVDNSTSGQYELHETPSNKLKFLKPNVCAEHEFRVAAVNNKQFGNFSDFFHVGRPKLEFYKFNLQIADMELIEMPANINTTFKEVLEIINDDDDDDQAKDNFMDFVKLTLTYYWPPNLKEILDQVKTDLFLSSSTRNSDVCKYSTVYKRNTSNLVVISDNGTITEEYFLGTNISICQYRFLFQITSVTSKCGTIFFPSGNQYEHEFSKEANVNCHNVRNAKCPETPETHVPITCKVDEFSSEYNKMENTFDVKWTYNNTTSTKPVGFLYQIGLTESDKMISDYNFNIINLTDIIETNYISMHSQVDYFNVSIPLKMSINKSYYMQICEVYGNVSHHEIKWSIVRKYYLNDPNDILQLTNETMSDVQYIFKSHDSLRLCLYIGIGILSCVLLNFLVLFVVRCCKRRRAMIQPLRDFKPSIFEQEKNEYILSTFSKL